MVTEAVSGGVAAVANPVASIDATAEFEDAHCVVDVTSFVEPSLYKALAVNCCVNPDLTTAASMLALVGAIVKLVINGLPLLQAASKTTHNSDIAASAERLGFLIMTPPQRCYLNVFFPEAIVQRPNGPILERRIFCGRGSHPMAGRLKPLASVWLNDT